MHASVQANKDMPKVSIGLLVYNESRYIELSVRSLLELQYPNLEIIISDNASTDDTVEIINNIIKNDKRVHFHQFETNQGVHANFLYVNAYATGKYFMMASGHDLWSQDLVTECVHLLENHPDAMIAFGTPVWINSEGEKTGPNTGWTDTRGLDIVGRFMSVFWGNMNPILGLIRTNALPDLNTYYDGVGTDLILLLELVLKGNFVHAHKASFCRRQPRKQESYPQKLSRYKNKDTKIAKTFLSRLFPLFKLPYEILRVIVDSKIGLGTKLVLIILIVPAFPIKYILGKRAHNAST